MGPEVSSMKCRVSRMDIHEDRINACLLIPVLKLKVTCGASPVLSLYCRARKVAEASDEARADLMSIGIIANMILDRSVSPAALFEKYLHR